MKIDGQSGTKYSFDFYSIDTVFKALGAVYVITERTLKPAGGGSHAYIYVGETGDLGTRFSSHHKQDCFDTHRPGLIALVLTLTIPTTHAALKKTTFLSITRGPAMTNVCC